MIISLLITLLMGLVCLIAFLARNSSPTPSFFACVLAITGVLFAWFPDTANDFAIYLGVGRGADLISYIWISLSFIATLLIFVRLRAIHAQVTILARTIAILQAGQLLVKPEKK